MKKIIVREINEYEFTAKDFDYEDNFDANNCLFRVKGQWRNPDPKIIYQVEERED